MHAITQFNSELEKCKGNLQNYFNGIAPFKDDNSDIILTDLDKANLLNA